ncbi:glycosyltransferase [Pelagibacteraceae bacterium]|jgi:glycosyltransferase involved in cell wall biosynthesis|nr:glycosyltransferase [Pelagibacteraceae bacterium]
MKKIIILIPVFNDWESLIKLINEINENIKDYKNINFECIVVNDASTSAQPKLTKPNNIKSLQILNMKENRGHARCNAFGIRYVYKNKEFDNLILMDGDGEDRPVEIKKLINEIINNPNNSVVAKRIKRSEGLFFQLLYQFHKIITYIFTGENISFGNYSCLTYQDVETLHSAAGLWSSYSGTVKKNLKHLSEINSVRGLRYFGPSQMSFLKLLIHSFSIIAVFKHKVFLRSTFMFIIFVYLNPYLGNITVFFQILIIMFNLIVFIVSLREKENELQNSHKNLASVEDIIR